MDKKSCFPKIPKKIASFLSDESGKITKKSAVGIAASASILGFMSVYGWQGYGDPASQGHVNGTSDHFNMTPTPGGGHGSVYAAGSCGHVNSPNPHYGHISVLPPSTNSLTSGHGNS